MPGTPGTPECPYLAYTTDALKADLDTYLATIVSGADGADGAAGAAGVGVPTGGTSGQVLAKASNTNYDTEWVTLAGGGGGFSQSDGDDRYVQLAGGGTGGHMTGNLGIGIAPSFPLHVETSNAGEKIALFKNTSATGLGVRIQNGLNTNYALKISNAAAADVFQVFGNPIAILGNNPTALASAVANGTRTSLVVAAAEAIAADGQIFLWGSGAGPMVTMLRARGNDYGFSLSWNNTGDYTTAATPYFDQAKSQQTLMFEVDGVTSLVYAKPYTTGAGAWDIAGKGINFHVGGVGAGATQEFASISTGQIGRGLTLGVSDVSSNTPVAKIRIKGDAGSNPISIYVNGSLKNVTQGANDSGGAGFAALRVAN